MEIIFAGFGGQGVLTSGLILAHIAMEQEYEVLWSPAYGGQMRGGKAFSVVKYDTEPIDEPNVTKLDALVALNQPSLDFAADLKEGGILIINSDAVDENAPLPEGAKVYRIAVDQLASQSGSMKTGSIVAVGALIKAVGEFEPERAKEIMCSYFDKKGKGKLNKLNCDAFQLGYDAIGD